DAWAGAGASQTGIAGALAVNVAGSDSEARVENGAALALSGAGDLTVLGQQQTESRAAALAQTSAGDPVIGVGASIAVNGALHSTQAALENATVAGAGDIEVGAAGSHTVQTDAIAGAETEAAGGAAVAVGVSNSSTTAEIVPGASPLAAAGGVRVA